MLPARDLYAESWAPLLDFGWSPLRSLRSQGFKYIEAPRAELYETARDPDETRDLAAADAPRAAQLRDRLARYATGPTEAAPVDRDALARLQALGYASGSPRSSSGARPDPKDRREIAARLSQVVSGELQGPALEAALRRILSDDAKNPQANLRLGYVLLESNRCAEAVPFLKAAIAAKVPSADPYLGLALCQAAARRLDEAQATLREAERVEPDNPVVLANLGIVLSDAGKFRDAIPSFQRALTLDPNFHEARFNLARAYARAGQRQDAAREAQELLTRLPANAPQRAEVQRLLELCGESAVETTTEVTELTVFTTEERSKRRRTEDVELRRPATVASPAVAGEPCQRIATEERDLVFVFASRSSAATLLPRPRRDRSLVAQLDVLRASPVHSAPFLRVESVISVISRDSDPHLSLTAVRHSTRPTTHLLSRWIHRVGSASTGELDLVPTAKTPS